MGRYCIIFMLKLHVVVHTSNPSTWGKRFAVSRKPSSALQHVWDQTGTHMENSDLSNKNKTKAWHIFNIRLCLIFGSSLHLMEEMKPVFLDVRIKRVNIHLFFCFLLSCLKPVMQARNRRFMTDSLLPLTTDIPVLNMFSWSCSLTILHLPSSCHTYWCFDHPPM